MKNLKSQFSIKLLALSLLSAVALWSYTPSSSISSIQATIAANSGSSKSFDVNGIPATLYKVDGPSNPEYAIIPSLGQYFYADDNSQDWWIRFTTTDGLTADLALNFQDLVDATTDMADIGMLIVYNGDTIEGIVKNIPKAKPSGDENFDFTLSDGTTGVLSFSPSASQFTISIN